MEFTVFIIVFISVVYGYVKLSNFNSKALLVELEKAYGIDTGNLITFNNYLSEKCSDRLLANWIADVVGILVMLSFIVLLVVDALTVYFINTTTNNEFIFYVAGVVNILWLIFVAMMVNPLCKLLCNQYFGASRLIRNTLESAP